jgi:AraC-like DNA-binding protein
VHDGSSATDAGFSYQIIHIDPFLVQKALGGKPLPFVDNPIVELGWPLPHILSRAWDVKDDLDDVEDEEVIASVASLLEAASSDGRRMRHPLPLAALQRVREALAADPANRRTTLELECISGLDRWTLARGFRIAYGTSPRGFRTMRQLDKVRRLVLGGASFADAALAAGFSDQSHMSRMFKSAYGLTPMQWTAAIAGNGLAGEGAVQPDRRR